MVHSVPFSSDDNAFVRLFTSHYDVAWRVYFSLAKDLYCFGEVYPRSNEGFLNQLSCRDDASKLFVDVYLNVWKVSNESYVIAYRERFISKASVSSNVASNWRGFRYNLIINFVESYIN